MLAIGGELAEEDGLRVIEGEGGHGGEEARPLQREACEGRIRVLGVDDLETLQSEERLALLLQVRPHPCNIRVIAGADP